MRVSVILPTKNEEDSIEELIEECRKVIQDCEIIVVDDSTDRTPEIAEGLGCRVIRGVGGYGRAFIEGFRVANGDYVVFLDADGSYSPKDIPALLEPLVSGKADLVIGSRFKGRILPGAMPFLHRYIGNPLLTFILNLLFKTNISDAHSGMRGLRRDAMERLRLRSPGMEMATEMIVEAKRKGLRIAEVPITYYPRKGDSKLRSFRDGWRHLRFMLLLSPDILFLLPSLLFITSGIGLMLYVLAFEPIRTHSLILSSMLIILGTQTLFFGVSSKIYSHSLGLTEEGRITRFFSRYRVLEEGIMLGIILICSGIALGYKILGSWFLKEFGQLNELNYAVLSLTLIIVGFQIIFNAFFVSSLVMHTEQ